MKIEESFHSPVKVVLLCARICRRILRLRCPICSLGHKVHYYFPTPLDEAREKLVEWVWIGRVEMYYIFEEDELNVGFWYIRLIQVATGFRPKAKMVLPENIN
jgi:hypothetical protein